MANEQVGYRRFEETATAPPLARARSRPTVDYEDFVLRYARAQGLSAALVFGGAGLIVGAGRLLDPGGLMLAVAAVGLALMGAGGSAFIMRAAAHGDWLKHLSMIDERTYSEPPAAGAAMVRPFIASSNGPSTIRAGRFSLPAATWRALFQTAAGNGGRLTRDAAMKVLPRELYRSWAGTMEELQRLGLVDGDGRPTAAGWRLAGLSPFPTGNERPAGADSTHARRAAGAPGLEGVGE